MTDRATIPALEARSVRRTDHVGAIVVGGDYQGLGIVRSLGQRGIPVFVVDDEQSLSRFSKYTTKFLHRPDLRNERNTVDSLLEIGKRFRLEDWVLYPTREETVAAFSRYRAELEKVFRVPTPDWNCVQWAWDKRNTYKLAKELGIPTPMTFCPKQIDQLQEISHLAPPFAIKPAIKEHFIYTESQSLARRYACRIEDSVQEGINTPSTRRNHGARGHPRRGQPAVLVLRFFP